MGRRRSLAVLALVVSATLSVTTMTDVAAAASVSAPAKVTAVSARPGPGVGQITFSWKSSGKNTTSFVIETALTSFKAGDARLPDHGRGYKYFTVSGKKRSVTLSAAQVAAAGARVSSANHLYYRFKAVHKTAKGTATAKWPYQQWVAVQPATPSSVGTPLRVASFNVRTAKAAGPSWASRAPLVASTIIARNPGVVALQELGPGRADGKDGALAGAVRQTDSLVNALRAKGVTKYQLVRSTSYVQPGLPTGTQGARILFDSTRYRQVSTCAETTAGSAWSPSCSMSLPKLSADAASTVRHAAYVTLADLATGTQFVVVSVHLDARHSTKASTEHTLEALRATQLAAVLKRVAAVNPGNLPVVLAGDLNSWQNNQNGYRAHDALVSAGYFDTAAAKATVNARWTTYNGFATTIPANASGWGARLDVIAVKGISAAARFENVMTRVQTHRASDHNMVVADVRLP